MFYDQLKKLCELHATSPTSVVEKLGMSRGSMSNWKKGGTPNGEAIVRFSEFFGVSTDYLLLGKESPQTNIQISAGDQLILDKIKNLTDLEKAQIAGALPFIIMEIQSSETLDPLFILKREKAGVETFGGSTGNGSLPGK